MCSRHALLPRTLKIPICYDRTGVASYRGGFADVWKGEDCSGDVAVKVLRTYLNSDLQKIIGVSCRLYLFPGIDALTKPCTEVLQGGCDVENPSTSKCAATHWGDDDRDSIRNGIRVDGKWKHEQLREGTSGRSSVRACRCSIRSLVVVDPLTTTSPSSWGASAGD